MRQARAVTTANAQQHKDAQTSSSPLLFNQLKNLYQQHPFPIAIVQNQQCFANPELQEIFNIDAEVALFDLIKQIHPEDQHHFIQLHHLNPEQAVCYKIRHILNNHTFWYQLDAKLITEENQKLWILSFHNIDALQQQNIQLAQQLKSSQLKLDSSSEQDILTGLLNRQGLKRLVLEKLALADTTKDHIGLMLIGLDHFKNINDTLGYHVGDHVLASFAKNLTAFAPSRALIGRLGSDEFAVVIPQLENLEHFQQIGRSILELVNIPIYYHDKILHTGMSIGCSFFPQDGSSLSELLQCADTALNDLKNRGRGGIRFFSQELFNVTRNKAIQLETAHNILRADLISPYYQPKIELKTGQLIGLEALLRWHCPESHAMFMPETVTEAFNDYELATQISENMQLKVFKDIQLWQKQAKQVVPVAINAAPVEFFRDNYAETLLARIEKAGIPTSLIEIEITEHLFSDRSVDYVIRALKKLQQVGIKISLDDFGTGHSSLTHLRDLPVNSIKIDYSFTKKINDEKPIAAIVEGIVKLGPLLNMNVIAEGIENQKQLDLLIKMGCPQGQGFLFRDAMTSEEILKLL